MTRTEHIGDATLILGDCREVLPALAADSVHCVVTSPPYYGLRDYAVAGQLGLEATPEQWVAELVAVFAEVRRVLRPDGTCWVNVRDSYASAPLPGFKPKDLLMMPARLALALQADGWWLRSRIIWAKPNPMPESVTDRPTSSYEEVLLLTRSARYFYDADAVREAHDEPWRSTGKAEARGFDYMPHSEDMTRGRAGITRNAVNEVRLYNPPGRSCRNVWTIATEAFPGSHYATMPTEIVRRCIKAGTSERGCCAACGAPWLRQTQTKYRRHDRWFGDKQDARHARGSQGSSYNEPVERTTTGWSPSCQCNVATVPCAVLDPFSGAGTTALVAGRLQRAAIGIELSPAYHEIARRRIANDAPLLAYLPPATDSVAARIADLFAEPAA